MESELNTITQLEQLQILSLENCNISQLPENIGQLQKLKEASFIANQLKQLPPSFYELKQLEKLWLLQNPLYLVVESQLKSGLPNCEIKL
jgi:Leucine-rich repeat (LRR) protein